VEARVSESSGIVSAHNPAEAGTAKVIYILYLFGLVVGITPIVGLIMAYVNRPDASDWVQTHYRMQIRTFWIGLLYGVVSMVTMMIGIGFLLGLFTLIWWIVRCAKGLKLLGQGLAYEDSATWLW
jgi:uncharacterized membrane protein